MPYIQEETITIKLYKLHKGKPEDLAPLTNKDFAASLEDITQELAGDGVVVEVEQS